MDYSIYHFKYGESISTPHVIDMLTDGSRYDKAFPLILEGKGIR